MPGCSSTTRWAYKKSWMKRVPEKSADNGWAATARMAESCAKDIDCVPPRKSSAERRMRVTSPKLRVDEAGGGSLISPEPVGFDAAKEVPKLPMPLSSHCVAGDTGPGRLLVRRPGLDQPSRQ